MSGQTNRQYRSSVFTQYFGEKKERLIEVYNAIKGTSYPLETEVEINTLEKALYMNRLNDLSFVIDGKLVILLEHQTGINHNMPVRFLLYIARIYEKIIHRENIYQRNQFKIPRPDFIVLYNGTEDCPEKDRLLLSDAFEGGNGEKRLLELEVKVYNINDGQNAEILAKSEALKDYSSFVSRVRENIAEREWDLGSAVEEAIAYCIRNKIMSEFLGKHGSEVRNMLFTEWDMDEALAVRFDEGIELGIEKGIEKGREEGREETAINALRKGLSVEDAAEISVLSIDRVKELQTTL
jgi:hypothetical protein